ncbi:MAG: M28 family peptidase, partial [Thermoanaerobaculia bacterium]
MKKLLFLIFLVLNINLFTLDYFIRCERKEKNDLIYLLKKNFKVVDETTYSLFLVLNEEEKSKIEKEFNCEVLDQNPENFEYYRIGLREDSNIEIIKNIGKELYKEENWVLIRIYPGANLEELKEARVFAGKINLEGFKLPKEEKKEEKINLLFAPDPLVQKIVNSVSTTDIDNFWNQITTNSPYGTRYSTTQGCQNAANWCLNQFQSFGLQTQTQNHTSGHAPNVIGIHQGALNPANIYIVEGHLDDMPSSGAAPGADDNASGSIHVLEAAKVLSCWGFKNTLKFLLVTGEEFGLYGSTYYANQAYSSGENILGVINMDMPGWEGNAIPNPENLDLNYNAASEDLGLFYAQVANTYSTGLVVDAFLCPSLDASDHYPFWQKGYKAVCGITDNEGYCSHAGTYPYYHTSNDTIWNCGNQSNNHNFFYSTVKTTVAAMAELGKPFKITFNKNSYSCSGQAQVILADRNLNTNPSTQQSYVINIWSSVETTPESLTLSEDGVNSIYFKGTINLTTNPPAHGDGAISVANNSTIYTTYTDSLDCDGQTNVQYNISAPACTPPIISNVQVINITPNSATITWQTNIPATSKVTYGTSIPTASIQEDLNYVTSHSITLTGLSPCTKYYFSVTSIDESGNSATDNNSGNWYQFTTLGAIYVFGPDNVEGGVGNWVATGQFHRDTCKAHSGLYSWKAGSTTCPGTYNASTTSQLTLNQDINLGPAGHGYHLKFWEYYNTEAAYDWCRPQISTNGGSTWITLGTQYAGQSGGWIQKDYDLSSYSGNIRIRFEFYADSLYNYEGWYIDDIEISKGVLCTPDLKFNSSSFTDVCNGTGSGSGNGIIDSGEDVSLNLSLINNGLQTATGVSATILTITSGISITDNSSSFPNILGGGGTGASIDGFSFKVAPSVSCGTIINFTININSNEGSWSDSFSLTVGQWTGGTPINLWSESFDGTT